MDPETEEGIFGVDCDLWEHLERTGVVKLMLKGESEDVALILCYFVALCTKKACLNEDLNSVCVCA